MYNYKTWKADNRIRKVLNDRIHSTQHRYLNLLEEEHLYSKEWVAARKARLLELLGEHIENYEKWISVHPTKLQCKNAVIYSLQELYLQIYLQNKRSLKLQKIKEFLNIIQK